MLMLLIDFQPRSAFLLAAAASFADISILVFFITAGFRYAFFSASSIFRLSVFIFGLLFDFRFS